MTSEGTRIGREIAADLLALAEHSRRQPDEADAIVCAIVAHLQSWRPVQSLTALALDLEALLWVEVDEPVRLAGDYPADEQEAAP